MSDIDGFIRDIVQNGSANRAEYDIDKRACSEMVALGWLTSVGRDEYIVGPMGDIHLARGFDVGDDRAGDGS